jgi:hypothetical protein
MVVFSKIDMLCNDLDLLKEATPVFAEKVSQILREVPRDELDSVKQQKIRTLYGYLVH